MQSRNAPSDSIMSGGVVVHFPNCNRHTADKYIFSGVQFVAIPSEL